MRTFLIAASAAAVAFSTPTAAQDVAAPSGVYKLDRNHASVSFSVIHLNLAPYIGRFGAFDATIDFNAETPAASSVKATVAPGSIDTGYPTPEQTDFDAELAGSDWLDAQAHPQASFVSTSIRITGAGEADVVGDLTLNGVTLPATFATSLVGSADSHPLTKAPALGFVARAVISRSAFGVAPLPQFVGDEVEIVFRGEFQKATTEG